MSSLYSILRSTHTLTLDAIRPDLSYIPIEYLPRGVTPIETMTDSDIRDILYDKRKELMRPVKTEEIWWEGEPFSQYFWSILEIPETEVDEIVAKFHEKQQNGHIRTCISKLEYELRQRTNPTHHNTKEDLAKKKQEVPIRDVVSHFVQLPYRARPGSLIKCPFPDHNDWSASFMIYDKTNSCRCFGCNKGGSAVDFIMEMTGCSLGEAIKKFLLF